MRIKFIVPFYSSQSYLRDQYLQCSMYQIQNSDYGYLEVIIVMIFQNLFRSYAFVSNKLYDLFYQ